MKRAIGLAIAVLAGALSAAAQDASGVQEAVRWERAKDAAALRQARVESAHGHKPAALPKAPAAEPEGTKIGDPGVVLVPDGARWERTKDAAPASTTVASAKTKKK